MKIVLTIVWIIHHDTNAIPTDKKIPDIIVIVLDILINEPSSEMVRLSPTRWIRAIASQAHNSSNTTDTVVEVGSLKELYTSSRITSAITTEKKTIIIS